MNYCPISILSTFGKISERAVYLQLYEYMNQNHLLFNRQFGFRPQFLTVTALTDFADEVLNNTERGKFYGAVVLNLNKAFGTIGHGILLTKLLKSCGFPTTLRRCRPYFSHRKQRMSCGLEFLMDYQLHRVCLKAEF